ncbi:cornichon family protein [Striga asiatica]|uniref:Cornichon family protein n=1 Tax=Striga asiatica TaxID=4170 RepID=A0A5A7PFB6_STRAF|nr:cornichon family protein [Striga asiatica]
MASMASNASHIHCRHKCPPISKMTFPKHTFSLITASQQKKEQEEPSRGAPEQKGRREIILRSSGVAVLGAIFHFSGTKPNYLGVQKSPPGLALCPATNNCVSTSENMSDLTHYAPPWNYNPEEGRGSKKPVTKERAMEELLEVFVDDVEFWFPPSKKPLVQYRSASRLGNFDFDINKKRVKRLLVQKELGTAKQRGEENELEMADLFAWLFSFFIVIALVGIILYQLMCLADLECDYINPYDSASRINKAVLPEFVTQGVLCLLHLITGHWTMFLLSVPYSYYNITLYFRRQHLVDVTEIFNQLPWEKKVRFYKLGYLVIFLALTIFLMIWSIVDV